jgi:glyoxylase-like metal-dependent hydrolase (beta-lactamase superfamily II)
MRLTLTLLVGLSVLTIIAGLAFLLPPHLQTQAVEPSLPSEAELLAFGDNNRGPVSIRYINTASQNLPDGILTHSVFVIEWQDGRLFVVDTGMDSATAIEFGKPLESVLGAEPAISHGDVAELLGDGIEKVAAIAFTHLHIDHTQGIVPFCHTRGGGVTAYQTTWQSELHNFNTDEGANLISSSCLAHRILDGEGILTMDDFPGLGIVAIGGHTPGSTLFVVPIDDTLWLLSGDTTNSKELMLSNTGKGFIYSYLLVPENTARMQALRLWLSRLDAKDNIKVIVSHDLGDIRSSDMREYVRSTGANHHAGSSQDSSS